MNDFFIQVEKIIKRILSPVETTMIIDMVEIYEKEDILKAIESSKYKQRPIDYARAILRNNAKNSQKSQFQPEKSESNAMEQLDWMSAWNIIHDDDAPEDLKKKALDIINKRRG